MSFREILTFPIGDPSFLSYTRGAMLLLCFAAFLMTWRVSISSYALRAERMERYFQRYGMLCVTIYFLLVSSNAIPTAVGIRFTPLFAIIYIGIIQLAFSAMLRSRDSKHRRDRVAERSNDGIQEPSDGVQS